MERRLMSGLFAGLIAGSTACLLWPATGLAREVLDFKPVPRESVSRFEKIKVVRATPAPDPTDTLSFGESTPDVPPLPSPPSVIVDRSGGVMKIGSDIHVGPDEVIHGDLSSVNGDITIEGHVEGDVVAMRGDVELKSTARVDGDVVCLGGQLTEEPGARVTGQKVTAGHSGAWNIRDRGDGDDESSRHESRRGDRVAGSLVWLIILTLFGWLFVRVGAARTVAAVETFNRSPGLSLGIGSLIWALIIPSLIALVLVVALLCITIIGIPLALAALVGYAMFLAVLTLWGFIVAATILGGGLSKASQDGTLTGVPASAHPAGVAGAPMAGVAGVAPGPGPSLTRRMLIGVGVLSGSVVVAQVLRTAGDGPIHGFGTLILVLGIIASSIATTIGAGALLRSEIAMGTFQVIWNGRRFGKSRAATGHPHEGAFVDVRAGVDPANPAPAAGAPWPPQPGPPAASAPWPPQPGPPAASPPWPPMPSQPAPPESFKPPVDPAGPGGGASSQPPQEPPQSV